MIINCRRQIHLDFHTPEFSKDCFKKFNADKTADTFVKAHIQAVKVFAKDHFGNSFYNTKVGHKHNKLKFDYLAEMIKSLHNRNIKVMAYYSVCFDHYVAKKHPDWLQKSVGEVYKDKKETWNHLCLNSPYQEKIMLPQIEEIIKNYDTDGVWLDIVHFKYDEIGCLCEWCRKKFQILYKKPLTKENVKLQLETLEEFKQKTITEFIKNIKSIINTNKPHIALTYNGALNANSSVESNEMVSFGAEEVHPCMTFYSPEITGAALRTTGKPFECIPVTFHLGWGEWTNTTIAQLKYECASTIYSGGNINLGDHMPPNGKLQKGVYNKIKEAFLFIKKREKYTTDTESICYAAILRFGGTFYWNRPVWSASRMLSDGHEQYDILSPKNITEKLCNYKVLIIPYQPGFKKPPYNIYIPTLPNLTKEQISCIKEWVQNGGTLLFNYDINLFDCAGIDCMGQYKYSIGYLEQTKKFAKEFDLPLLMRSPFKKIKCITAKPILKWYFPYCEPTSERFFSNIAPPGELAPLPAVTVNKYGNGRVIYFAFDIFTDYVDNMHPWTKQLFLDILKTFAPVRPFVVKTPSTVHTRMTKKAKEYYIHFLNSHVQPRTIYFNKADVYPTQVMEDFIPIYNTIVEIPKLKIKEAILEPAGEKLEIKRTKNNNIISIPKIEIYDILKLKEY